MKKHFGNILFAIGFILALAAGLLITFGDTSRLNTGYAPAPFYNPEPGSGAVFETVSFRTESRFTPVLNEPEPLTPSNIALFAGSILTLILSYFPGLKTWFSALDSKQKSIITILLLMVSTLLYFSLSCVTVSIYALTCDRLGFKDALNVFIQAAISSQATYLLTRSISDTPIREYLKILIGAFTNKHPELDETNQIE